MTSTNPTEPMYPSSLRMDQRPQARDRATTHTWDVVVIGAGITGAGVALDAASRGLSTLLLERADLASGTSRWSSKLCHGGLRYLAKAQIDVAWESARERHWLMTRIAPHLTRATTFNVPLNHLTGPAMGVLTEMGIRASDVMRMFAGTPSSVLPMPRRLDRASALETIPGLRREGLRGAIQYWDGQLDDDARLVTTVVRTAVVHGATVLTRCGVTAVESTGGGFTVTAKDEIDGTELSISARTVVNATACWVHELDPDLDVLPSRGSHLVFRSEALGNPKGVFTAPVPGHFGRFIFAIPQPSGVCFVGLTDDPAPGVDAEEPPVPENDVQFLLDTLNATLENPVTEADIIGRFAGLRPLIQDKRSAKGGSSADVSRKHLLIAEPGKPIAIVGGKLTTYRRMAQDAVDAVCSQLGVTAVCRTYTLPLVGAADRSVLAQLDLPERLVRRYGTQANIVVDLAERYPEFAGPVAEGLDTIGAEFLYAIAHEGALTVDDVIARRTRCTFVDAAVPEARAVAQKAFAALGLEPVEV